MTALVQVAGAQSKAPGANGLQARPAKAAQRRQMALRNPCQACFG
jgi:hypothetical protein